MSGARSLACLLIASALVGGCAVGSDARDPNPPPDAVQVRVYTNGGERFPEAVKWRFQGIGHVDQTGVVTWIPEGTCISVSRGWSLRVTTELENGDVRVDAATASRDFSGESPLNLAIERRDGRVTVTEGIPDWWEGAPIRCAPT